MGRYTGQKYCPSNSTAGDVFMSKFCERCSKEKFIHTQVHGDKQCDILNKAIVFEHDNPNFPKEWQYGLEDNPLCTAYRHHNWQEGEPAEEEVFNPQQIKMEL
jgi:hypothetical protein